MSQLSIITSRNLKQYLRDKGAIFFSLLSMLIVILLMFFFLADSNTNSITDLLSQFPGRDPAKDKENAALLVLAWTCAGIVSINAVTVTQASLSYMIRDRETGTLSSIYTAPVSRLTIRFICPGKVGKGASDLQILHAVDGHDWLHGCSAGKPIRLMPVSILI